MSTHLLGIAKKAETDKAHRFRGLYGELNEEFLRECWWTLRRDAASGVDHLTWADYHRDRDENIPGLAKRLQEKRYRAKMIRRKWIPKGNDTTKLRPLGIPAIEDKLVQKAAARILEAIYEPRFYRLNYGYRPKRGARDAVRFLTRKLQFGRYGWVVEADIRSFFDRIDHDWLIKMLERRIDDKTFLQLIRKWLKAGVLEEDGTVVHPETGSPQGGTISPVLSNIYLHHVLDEWFMKVFREGCRGEAGLVRYADDFVAVFGTQADAVRFHRELEGRMKKFGLELAAEKTRVISFPRRKRAASFEFLGFEFRWGVDKQGRPHLKRRTAPKKLRTAVQRVAAWCRENRHTEKKKFFALLKTKLSGHNAYYGVVGNIERLKSFTTQARWHAWRWLRRRNSHGKISWEGFRESAKHFQIPPPRITERGWAHAGA